MEIVREEELRQKMFSAVDEKTREWMQTKTKEIISLFSLYKCAMMEVETKFRVFEEEFSSTFDRSPISSIKTRLKSLPSIRAKMERLGVSDITQIPEHIRDIAGVRVICPFPEDVYLLADALLRQDDVTLIEKKDYIAHPKENGYRSLHVIVSVPVFPTSGRRDMTVEVQLRTIAMDFWASLEHQMRYKKNTCFTEEMAQELYACAEASAALDRRMERLQKSAFATEKEEKKI
ncbi:MAG: GTP pyrophosphokinase family protein [Clostridia bacterium]|nr:GTP pyrophosphokinase family protein [Clostridia bacterium]